MHIINVENVSMVYRYYVDDNNKKCLLGRLGREKKEKLALKNMQFNIEEGDIVGYVGLNGAGKTTTIKILSGIIKPTLGEVTVLGFNPFEKKSEYLQQISLVMGSKSQLFWDLPVIDSIEFLKSIYNVSSREYKKNLEMMVDTFNVGHLLGKQVRRLSLGERMKMELIASLIHSPKMIFLDEPSIGLDIISQKEIRKFLKTINHEWSSTILLTSHNIDDISEVCNKLMLIDSGRMCFNGEINDFEHLYGNKVIKLTVLNNMEHIISEIRRAELVIVDMSEHQLTLEATEKGGLEKIQNIWNIFGQEIVDISIENKDLKELIENILRKKV